MEETEEAKWSNGVWSNSTVNNIDHTTSRVFSV